MILKKKKMIERYQKVNKEEYIQQGDIFLADLKYEIKSEDGFSKINNNLWIVTSNSCDIKQNKLKYISISPIVPLYFVTESVAQDKKKKGLKNNDIKDDIKKLIGNLIKYNNKKFFYLPKNKSFYLEQESVVMLEIILTFRIDEVENIIKEKRLCSLSSPDRENLGWAIGNLYNRVAVEDYHKDHHENLFNEIKNRLDAFLPN